MFFHLHIASIHYGISTAKSIDITIMMLHNSSEHNQIIEAERNVLSDAYHNSIDQVLTAGGILNNQDQIQTILQEINKCVHTELQSNHFKSCSITLSAPVKHKTDSCLY
jgi:shikimate kinase